MERARVVLIVAAILGLALLLGASAFESVVTAPNFNTGIPDSLRHMQGFMQVRNPGHYFRVVSPLTQILLLLSAIVCWRGPRGRRWSLVAALIAVVTADIITFTFHYPRNAILFGAIDNTPIAELEQAAREWAVGNYVRVLLVLVSLGFSLRALWITAKIPTAATPGSR